MGHSVLERMSLANSSELRGPCGRGGRKTVGARGDGGHLGNKNFQTQQDQCALELTETEAAHAVLAKVCARCSSSAKEGCGHMSRP